jgi:hypothetical protein
MEEHWAPPCPDPTHVGTNERFCSDCVRVCGSCNEDICDNCFYSRDKMLCRRCVLGVIKEVEEWDERRKSGVACK